MPQYSPQLRSFCLCGDLRPACFGHGAPRIPLIVLIALMLGMGGCAATPGPPVAGGKMIAPALPEGQVSWRAVRFRLHWPENATPAWNMDLLLAHRVVAPVLSQHQDEILLWRFHRRAGRDGAGHQFSFLFYAPAQTAETIEAEIRASALLDDLQHQGAVEAVLYDDPQRSDLPQIEDTSDRNWSQAVQKAWPYYIMGVSQMWLTLIELYEKDLAADASTGNVADIQALYTKIDEKITATWENEGRHAFLHHLNALFGYSAMKFYLRF